MKKIFRNISIDQITNPVSYLTEVIQNYESFVFLLTGVLGAGKTTFVSHFLKSIDINFFAQSPTYNLMHQYVKEQIRFFHFDLYRIQNELEIENLGFYEYWEGKNFCFVEWWQKAENYFDTLPNTMEIQIEILNENHRNFIFKSNKNSFNLGNK